MAESGEPDAAEARTIVAIFDRRKCDPNAFVITPGLLQIVARKG